MSTKNTFVELTTRMAKKQEIMVDALTCDAPVIAGMPMQAASHGLYNLYEELNSIIGGNIVDMDGALPAVDIQSSLRQMDLSIIGGILKVGEDKAKKFKGPVGYFANRLPAVLRQTGMNMESALLYNNIRAKAFASSKLKNAGGTGSANYSIIIVSWIPGEITGLYDEDGFGKGDVFDIMPLNDGKPYEDPGTPGRVIYAQRLKSYFGIQIANPQHISGIVNIDLTDNAGNYTALPTEMMINDALADARARPGVTKIYCHPKVARAIGKYKGSHLNVTNGDVNLSFTLKSWDDIEIVTTYNLLEGSEAKVTL